MTTDILDRTDDLTTTSPIGRRALARARKIQARRRRWQWAQRAVVALMAVIWVLWFRPTTLGGPARYVLVSGESMKGTYNPGDLLILQHESHYKVGDIVVYRVPQAQDPKLAGRLVVHRIVGGNGHDGFQMRGDNRKENDVWTPHPEDIVGHPWIRIPNALQILLFLRSPIVLALFVSLFAMGLIVTFVPDPANPALVVANSTVSRAARAARAERPSAARGSPRGSRPDLRRHRNTSALTSRPRGVRSSYEQAASTPSTSITSRSSRRGSGGPTDEPSRRR